MKCGDLISITNDVVLRHSSRSRVLITMVTHNVKDKVKMRVVGSLLESGVGLSGISILLANPRRMYEFLRYPQIR